jgi:hypothetical protein
VNLPVLLLTALLAAPAAAQQLKDGAVAVEQTDAVVTVVSVDPKKRTVTIRGPKGNVATLDVPPEAQNLERVKAGDRFRMKIIEAVAVGIRKGGEPAQDDKREVKVSPKGGTPGGMVVKTQARSVVVDAIDYGNRYVAVRGTSGQTLALKVAEGVPLEQLSAGDRITILHTQALAVELEPQPAKKPAAKK